jgi:membrane-bound lytic murein transglycosylase D
MQEPLQFEEMKVPGGTPLSDVAKQIGVEPEVLYELNPHLIKKQTPPNREWSVRIPATAEGDQLA